MFSQHKSSLQFAIKRSSLRQISLVISQLTRASRTISAMFVTKRLQEIATWWCTSGRFISTSGRQSRLSSATSVGKCTRQTKVFSFMWQKITFSKFPFHQKFRQTSSNMQSTILQVPITYTIHTKHWFNRLCYHHRAWVIIIKDCIHISQLICLTRQSCFHQVLSIQLIYFDESIYMMKHKHKHVKWKKIKTTAADKKI